MEKIEAEENWSEAVEDLITAGDIDGAISLLQSVVIKLETLSSSQSDSELQLASALADLAKLYSSKGFSLKADELQSRAFLIKQRPRHVSLSGDQVVKNLKEGGVSPASVGSSCNNSVHHETSNHGSGSSDDDWEAVADREPDELLPSLCSSRISDLTLEDNKTQKPKRRGRGTFSYEKQELYSDQLSDNSHVEDEEANRSEGNAAKYGTRHVLVLSDFPPSTKTIDLEKLFKDFKDHAVVIRWINDTVALAVFQTPAIALEAQNRIQFPFTVRILVEDDTLLSKINSKDLEPPRRRPQTSARTAQRLIAQGMGLKLPTAFGTRELRKQEGDRRNRIVTRQKLRDEAWGGDEN
ncbi:Coiled-coil domain-containing protein R3HCC1L [Quillaja saponaria]|uniref:Coiled-coil domain-containing protein R3HCC1L n=1 Tax=Quillaja saponaria TaxID=32244 RepID=A0AAD7VML8_QUISA|nr:Coiled-coil domain-containing protein R3HCC1L [Quillaja saponaria]